MKRTLLALLLALSPLAAVRAQQAAAVTPLPQHMETNDGTFALTERTVISSAPRFSRQAAWLADRLAQSTGWQLRVADAPRKGGITLRLDTTLVAAAEGYRLDVTAKGVTVTARDEAGAFYGLQSLLQLMPAAVMSRSQQRGVQWTLPCVSVTDAPAHPYRGFMLDVARRYYDLSFVRKCIDWMSTYKLNKLQLHLIDDSGWRMEVKKYPRLTSVGAWAGEGAERTGGWYTQEELRSLVDYAAVRGVEIIPEIEFPAHIQSAIAAYPWLSCRGKQLTVPTQHFISEDILCVGKDSVMQFLRDVLDETMQVFPSRYINIGGDEAVYKRWEQCPRCQALMKREGISDASHLQGYLTNRVNAYLTDHGRTAVGWEEVMMRGRVERPLVAMLWHDPADTIKAREAGQKAVLTPCDYAYFDFPESAAPGEVYGATWRPPFGYEKTYSMPVDDYSPGGTAIGVQGCFWSDRFIIGPQLHEFAPIGENRAERYVEYFTFPRLIALSEVGWTARAARSFTRFNDRLRGQYARLDAMGCGYRVPEPRAASVSTLADGSREVTLSCPVAGATLRYTTDGTWPTRHSAVCADGQKVRVPKGCGLKAVTFVTDTRTSLPLTVE